jgi:hypothetical protein
VTDLQHIAAQLAQLQQQLAGRGGTMAEAEALPPSDNAIADQTPGASTERKKPMRRIHGPYPHRSRWRVVDLDLATNRRTYHHRPTRAEAEALAAELTREAASEGGATGRQLLAAYLHHLEHVKGNKPASVHTTEVRITGLLGSLLARPLRTITAADLKAAAAKPTGAGDTKLNGAAETRTFLRWLKERGDTKADLAAAIKVVARRRTTPKPVLASTRPGWWWPPLSGCTPAATATPWRWHCYRSWACGPRS